MIKHQLAIVIPFYKIEYFEKTLRSISQQTDQRFKVYIGNDCSGYQIENLLSKYLAEIEYSYIEYSENFGKTSLASQWNRLVDHIQEEWFQILGDDDTISKNFVEEFYRALRDVEIRGINLIRFTYHKINENEEVLETFDYPWKSIGSQEFLFNKLSWKYGSSLSENIFRKELYDKYKFKEFPLAWHSDDYSILELSNYGDLYNIRTAYVNVRVSELSITGNRHLDEEKLRASFLFYEQILFNKRCITNLKLYHLAISNYLFLCRNRKVAPNYKLIKNILLFGRCKANLSLIKTYLLHFMNYKK